MFTLVLPCTTTTVNYIRVPATLAALTEVDFLGCDNNFHLYSCIQVRAGVAGVSVSIEYRDGRRCGINIGGLEHFEHYAICCWKDIKNSGSNLLKIYSTHF